MDRFEKKYEKDGPIKKCLVCRKKDEDYKQKVEGYIGGSPVIGYNVLKFNNYNEEKDVWFCDNHKDKYIKKSNEWFKRKMAERKIKKKYGYHLDKEDLEYYKDFEFNYSQFNPGNLLEWIKYHNNQQKKCIG